ncbi:MAG: hypothetical protein H6706_14160 [Myxococcales bacterium]|nr:hypothetical protein [Myxococcales bacterium]
MRRLLVLPALALAILGIGGAASAATVLRLEPVALAERSVLIFIGTVSDQKSTLQESPRQVFTETTFRVEQVVKGEKQATFTLRQLGGSVGEGATFFGQDVPGYARFQVGERVALFLERTDTGRLVVTGLAQGKYTLRVDPKTGETMAERDLGGLHFVGRAPDKVFAGVPDANRMTLDQLTGLVHAKRPPALMPKVVRTRQVTLPQPEGGR